MFLWQNTKKKSIYLDSPLILSYGKCPKILYTKMSDKMAYANSADPDQTAPKGAVWSGSALFAIPLLLVF